jgi:hypothetical protein
VNVSLGQLARELELAAAEAPVKAAALVAKGAEHVKDAARRNAEKSSGEHAKLYPKTIGIDLDLGGLSAEIGPAKEGQGNLGHILEYGSVKYGGVHNPPHRDLGRALDAEEPLFLAEAAKMASPWS